MLNAYCQQFGADAKVDLVVSDRDCGALDIARRFGIAHEQYSSQTGREFSIKLASKAFGEDVLFLSFYTRLFTSEFIGLYPNRILNFHPSVLPAYPGPDGFGDSVRGHALFIGSTVHVVDEGLDTGTPVLQSVAPNNPGISLEKRRHILFVQQCKALSQIIEWFKSGQLGFDEGNRVFVAGARYEFSAFLPNLAPDIEEKWRDF